MIDLFGRSISYLRISITDRCNFRCTYCMPEQGINPIPHEQILRYEEILRIAAMAVSLGVKSIRVTGGEPLVRRGVVDFIRQLAALKKEGLADLALTTNGSLLNRLASPLKEAGLDRVNISLDTLLPDRFRRMTRMGDLDATLRGAGAAIAAGLAPVKVNVVVNRHSNLDEVTDFAYLAYALPLHVRYIELMPLGEAEMALPREFVPTSEVTAILSRAGQLMPDGSVEKGSGPAKYQSWAPGPEYIPGKNTVRAIDIVQSATMGREPAMAEVAASGKNPKRASVGFITAVSEHFCPSCSRLRLTADGRLHPCLWSAAEIDIKSPMRAGASNEELKAILAGAACQKPQSYQSGTNDTGKRRMSRLGG